MKSQKDKNAKSRIIDFYEEDKEIYELSKTMNFTKFVKTCLKWYLKERRDNG